MAEAENAHNEDQERIVSVYPDAASAQGAAEEARAAGAADVAVDRDDDEIRAAMGEMREEAAESWAGPSVGVYTREMVRRLPAWTLAGTIAGAVLALPLAFIGGGGVSFGGRMLIAAVCGGLGGGTIGFLVGGYVTSRRRTHAGLASEQGVVVGATGRNDAVVDRLTPAAVRVDRTSRRQPIDTVVSRDGDDDDIVDLRVPEADGDVGSPEPSRRRPDSR
jgi:hypothetical protein